MPLNIDSPLARRVVAFAFLVFIFGLTFWVLSPFFASLAWAGILAYVSWPLHQRVLNRLPEHQNLVALLMTLGVAATLLLPTGLGDVYRGDGCGSRDRCNVQAADGPRLTAAASCRAHAGRAAFGSPRNTRACRAIRNGCAHRSACSDSTIPLR